VAGKRKDAKMNEITLADVLKYASAETMVSLIKDCEGDRENETAIEIRLICWRALESSVGPADARKMVIAETEARANGKAAV